jgi:RNA polymerase primary sigma factor
MEGNLGLFTAVDKFNPDLGNRFSTCATPWIKQAIMKAITEKGKNVRLPANVYQALNNMKKTIDALAEDGILTPTDAQIAEKMGIEEEKIALLKQWKKDTVSLSVPLGDESEDTLEDLQADTHDESPVDYAERKMDEEFVREILKDLPDRTRTIMKMRYGLGDENDPEDWQNEHTLEEIGDYLGLTRERIRQIEKQTLQELKVKFAKYAR